MTNGWNESAHAWIEEIGDHGDWGRRYVLDAPMLARTAGRRFHHALDLGCGEGRFCRMLRTQGIAATGIDPVRVLVEQARRRDPHGSYNVARAEDLPFADASFDLVVAYLALIDVDDLPQTIREARRVLRRSGTFLIANLQSFNTAADPVGWSREPDGTRRFCIDHYLSERANWVEWRGIRVRNWHRPMQSYMRALLDEGFQLRHFAEPEPIGIDDAKADRYRRAPNFLIMEWEKTSGG